MENLEWRQLMSDIYLLNTINLLLNCVATYEPLFHFIFSLTEPVQRSHHHQHNRHSLRASTLTY
ncbi:hypothetical protein DERF_013649 [Dermatophagoides farinae]|uniref:Uncharacterized protein n=1 Tax=Dermatophagoides farinae TaxID=6954 RepID=A0A922KYW3_DERFA|nr:hypothetical protein DERF_013649 [Dermatophagoides farinae]